MSSGVTLTLVALALALVIAGLFRLAKILDSAELTLRRLVAGIRATRKDVGAAGELAAAVERDAAQGQAALDQLEGLKRGRRRAEP
jgi:outer membrane murein-binding lipoprotein Lpp